MFNGGAYSGTLEHFGQLEELLKIIKTDTVFYGNSCGTLFALIAFLFVNGHITQENINDYRMEFIEAMKTCEYINTTYFVFKLLRSFNKYVYHDMYNYISGKVIIGVTRRKGFKWIRKYKSNYHFFKTIIHSCNLSCMSTFTHKYLDGCYGYNAYQHLPKNTMIANTTYYPPLCLIPITNNWIIEYLYNLGKTNMTLEIERYNKDGMEVLVDTPIMNYMLLFDLHEKHCVIDRKWNRELKRLFHHDLRR